MWNIFVHACLFCPWFLFRTYINLALLCLSLQRLLLHLILKFSVSSILNPWLLFIFLLIFPQIMMTSVILNANNTEWQLTKDNFQNSVSYQPHSLVQQVDFYRSFVFWLSYFYIYIQKLIRFFFPLFEAYSDCVMVAVRRGKSQPVLLKHVFS